MPSSSAVVRIYVLGNLVSNASEQNFTLFCEYRSSRGLCKCTVSTAEINGIVTAITQFRGFVEGGHPVVAEHALQELGSRLFSLVIRGRARDLFFIATGEQRAQRDSLPLEIIAEDYQIAAWPWEYMFNPEEKRFISQDFHPISRNIFSISGPREQGTLDKSLRILVIVGVLPDDNNVKPDEEISVITEVFRQYLGDEYFDIDVIPAEHYQRLNNTLKTIKYDIVHYVGHAGFDDGTGLGYLSIQRRGNTPARIDANLLSALLRSSGARLVFLNACKTAKSATNDSPGRSSVAARLLDTGIPAVIGTQFSLPDTSAYSFAADVYRGLVNSLSLGDAMSQGRNAMRLVDEPTFFDWGIPVLYASDPSLILFPRLQQTSKLRGPKLLGHPLSVAELKKVPLSSADSQVSIPMVSPRPTRGDTDIKNVKKVRVALLDIDAKIGFMKQIVESANSLQSYYHFELVYHKLPIGYVRTDLGDSGDPQTFVPRLATFLSGLQASLDVDFLCGLTENMVAGEHNGGIYYNYFSSSIPGRRSVSVVSTYEVREYAAEAGTSFAAAVLFMCLGMLVACDRRWGIDYHKKTAGCLFDFCGNRTDLTLGLRHARFDHAPCRKKITDANLLQSIDAVLGLLREH